MAGQVDREAARLAISLVIGRDFREFDDRLTTRDIMEIQYGMVPMWERELRDRAVTVHDFEITKQLKGLGMVVRDYGRCLVLPELSNNPYMMKARR